MELTLPDKHFFKIGEVSDLLGVKPYVLRYWEKEFHLVRPQKSRTNQRVYSRKDVELIARIKHLLYDEKFTIAGAKMQLRSAGVRVPDGPAESVDDAPAARRSFLEERDTLRAERDALARDIDLLQARVDELTEEVERLRTAALDGVRGILGVLEQDDRLR